MKSFWLFLLTDSYKLVIVDLSLLPAQQFGSDSEWDLQLLFNWWNIWISVYVFCVIFLPINFSSQFATSRYWRPRSDGRLCNGKLLSQRKTSTLDTMNVIFFAVTVFTKVSDAYSTITLFKRYISLRGLFLRKLLLNFAQSFDPHIEWNLNTLLLQTMS